MKSVPTSHRSSHCSDLLPFHDRVHDRVRRVPGRRVLALALLAAWSVAGVSWATAAAERLAVSEQRLAEAARYLSSDELEGRGVGTEGLNRAADYLAEQFREMGLQTKLFGKDGSFQKFTITTETELGSPEKNRLILAQGGHAIPLELGKDFTPLAVGGSAEVTAPLLFAGYGITAKDLEYDDYAGLDAQGKIVVILRKEPQQDNPHSVFNGNENSQHALFRTKIANAAEHGAAAVVIVNDLHSLQTKAENDKKQLAQNVEELEKLLGELKTVEDAEKRKELHEQLQALTTRMAGISKRLQGSYDSLLAFTEAGEDSGHDDLPVFFARRESLEPFITMGTGLDLASLERVIDVNLQPHSRELGNWKAELQSELVRNQAEVKNVVAVLEGEGPRADETVVIGAHYDHLGQGGAGSLAPWTREIHNGADDNASGVAALLEVARILSSRDKPLPRRVVFIAFTGEERGLLGSAEYVRKPLFSLENTVAMINMDMVGRLSDNKLIVHGTGTAKQFDSLVDQLNQEHAFTITKDASGFGPSDHTSFYSRKVPVLHIFTGTHNDYHRPSDDFEKLNLDGLARITQFVASIGEEVAEMEKRPAYLATKPPRSRNNRSPRPYLGSIPDFSRPVKGYALQGVTPDSPASRGGLKAGDVIVKFGASEIDGLEAIDNALRKYKAGDKVKVVVLRDGKRVTETVVLDPPR